MRLVKIPFLEFLLTAIGKKLYVEQVIWYHVTIRLSWLQNITEVMEDFQTGEETSFAVDEVSGIIKDVRKKYLFR